jgi:xylan 1,4-beta-xylosidase
MSDRTKCCLPGAAGNLSCCAPPSPPIGFAIDLAAGKASPFPHYWERCVGSGHGALTMREDWRQHVAMAHHDIGIQRVRFHGILDDDMSVSFSANETGFVNVDSTCDFLLKHNMSMVMELGFMPRWLAAGRTGAAPTADGDGPYSCTHSINHYIGCSDPPSDFDLWGDLIYRLGKHLVNRYGVDEMANNWEFEVWNEPGPGPNGDWWGTPAEYYQLYSQAARALKRASPRLQVGGPAGCGGSWGNHGAGCLETFIDFCRNNASGLIPASVKLNGTVPLDFISTHEYAGGSSNVNNAESIVQHLSRMKPIATKNGLYHIMTEWGGSYKNGAGTGSGVGHAVGGTANYNYNTPAGWRGEQQDTHETAAFILQTILKSNQANLTWGEREATSYWDISDVFEEGGFAFANNSFNGNFGLINVHGIPKPAYRAFQLLHELGDELLPTTRSGGGSSNNPTDCAASVGVLASKSNATCLSVLVFSQATVGAPIAAHCIVNLTINTAAPATTAVGADDTDEQKKNPGARPSTTIQGAVRRIDGAHTAPKAAWLTMGMPQWPTPSQNRQIFEASLMQQAKLPIMKSGAGVLSFSLDVAANTVVAVQIPLGGDLDFIAAGERRMRRDALDVAEAQAVRLAAEIATLRAQLKSDDDAA